MRREVPERVLVGADRAEVHALAVDVVEPAELLAADHLLEARDDRVVLEQVPDHQHALVRRGERDQLLGVADLEREGLLDVDVLAGLQGHLREREVARRGRRDHHGLDVGIAQHGVEVAGQRRPGQLARHLVELLLVEVADVLEARVGELVEVAGEVLAPAADAGDSDLYGFHMFNHPLDVQMISQA